MGKVDGMTVEAPFPPATSFKAADRFDLAFGPLDELATASFDVGSAGLFAWGFGAVVFAITLFLCSVSS
jgi:hypothetical protein